MSKNSLDSFSEACGATGLLRLRVDDTDTGAIIERAFRQPFVLIGRDKRTDLPLVGRGLSRRHVYLQLIGGRVFCVDLQSRTGIRWEGERRSGWLDPLAMFSMGAYRVQLLGGARSEPAPSEEDPSPLSARFQPDQELPEATLEFLRGSTTQSHWRMNRVLAFVGRSPECKVQLAGPTVSRIHLSLVRTPLGVWVIDLLGRGGVSVNGTQIRTARLDDGDEIQVGNFIFRLGYDSKPAASVLPTAVAQAPPPAANAAAVSPAGSALMPWQASAGELARLVPNSEAVLLPAVLPPENADLARSVLMPVFQQLGQMQQQMFDQFQQALLMMVQMFSSMHRDQMGLIREELDRVQELTQELQVLQGELVRNEQRRSETAASAQTPAESAVNHMGTALEPEVVGEPPAPSLGLLRNLRTAPHASEAAGKAATPDSVHREESATAPATAAAAKSQGIPKPPFPGSPPEGDIHQWLCQRIATLQQERQSRWQKVLNFVLGKPPANPVP